MKSEIIKNEREWTGQLISWIKSEIEAGRSVFEDATNDSGLKNKGATTLFPDILLFTDKTSGIVFNGWELKFPDTAVDDEAMLTNALEKARRLKSESFVTWNAAEAIIWGIDNQNYDLTALKPIKRYSKKIGINTRKDLAIPENYAKHEEELRKQAVEILHDLEMLYLNGKLRPAINVSADIIQATRETAIRVIPQFKLSIVERKNTNSQFRREYAKWRILESATISILSTSSRRENPVEDLDILAKFTFYNLIGKIIFYLTLSTNLSGELEPLTINEKQDIKTQLNKYFNQAKNIDYQAVFLPYFTDDISFSDTADAFLKQLLKQLLQFDFRYLPTEVLANILSNLIPQNEKQSLGQYFTPETLANLVAYSVFKTNRDIFIDPTSGTGTFLNAFYQILKFYGATSHAQLLNQIWGNDISHFPALFSVINLYKQDVSQRDNFPKVLREDFFNLEVGKNIAFPNPYDHTKHLNVPIPLFDGIASNFPFIQQEDIPNDILVPFFREKFQSTQQSFLHDNSFEINERSDYFTYCIYNSLRFLKEDGCLAAITSNAWLGKEYGFQFKRFLLDNFHIKYVVKSNAEHWFSESKVATLYLVLERENKEAPTKFVTINFKLQEHFDTTNIQHQIQQIENFYADIENCEQPYNHSWEQNILFTDLFQKKDSSLSVCIVDRGALTKSIKQKESWNGFFTSAHIFDIFSPYLLQYHTQVVQVFRGERTGWNPMFIIKKSSITRSKISAKYLMPYIKSSTELTHIEFDGTFNHRIFTCEDNMEQIDLHTKRWIERFRMQKNRNGTLNIEQACQGHKPHWYSIVPKRANIITAINPYERFFFTFSKQPFAIDQRLVAMSVINNYDVELICALLNSAVSLLFLELRGTSRHLGALDLNADYLKEARFLNPDLLTEEQKARIKEAFIPLRKRTIGPLLEEINRKDRINFDSIILQSYGFEEEVLKYIYNLLQTLVASRLELKNK